MSNQPSPDNGSSGARLSLATWLGIAALAVSLLAAAAAGYAWYQSAVTARLEAVDQRGVVERVAAGFDELKQVQSTVEQRFDTLAGRIDELESQTDAALDSESRERSEAMAAFREEFDDLSASVEQVYAEIGRSVDTWMLEEAEQLLLLANQRLTLVHDADLAATALRLVDAKLEEVGDPALLPVRKQIADELAELGALPTLDVSGAALTLGALMQSVSDLPLSQDMQRPEWQSGEAPPDAAGESGGGMQRFAREILDDLGNLVRVRRVDEARLPKLKPVQRFLVHENLRMKLSAAQYALLREDADLYRQNLQAAKTWAGRYLHGEAEAVRNLVAELESLGDLPLDRELPSIDGSLAALRTVMSERASQ